jgi:hypothetical protein
MRLEEGRREGRFKPKTSSRLLSRGSRKMTRILRPQLRTTIVSERLRVSRKKILLLRT